ncbi:hypothetical protein [Polyangium jinanense]|uniref:Uncharacterized protein n=1 Tax=Polyangium jinanense TaxID=2829994 RepID=A0A9X3XAE4_9BACT|nr:hypothetical protein [Polyangium jinanense]MDC3961423.1 hypothetical protein [Polyangium jinanense]MDC3987024.1 hypothetical protein [Polyangium jinanense]
MSLVPVLIVAAGVTIIVVVTAHAVEETAEAIKKWPRKVEEKCQPPFQECLENPRQPKRNRKTYGDYKDCRGCLAECKREGGIWPEERCPRHWQY